MKKGTKDIDEHNFGEHFDFPLPPKTNRESFKELALNGPQDIELLVKNLPKIKHSKYQEKTGHTNQEGWTNESMSGLFD